MPIAYTTHAGASLLLRSLLLLDFPSSWQAMTASQVSGGFWCQLNLAFARQFDTRSKR